MFTRISRSLYLALMLLGCGVLLAVGEDASPMFEYTGVIREDAVENDEVTMDQEIIPHNKANLNGAEIYGYTIYKSHSEMPFKLILSDRTTGLAKVVLSNGYKLNYERRHRYSFEIAAHDRNGVHAERERIHIAVDDVNEFPPQWKQVSYTVRITEGKMDNSLVQLETTDEDGSDLFSSICNYHLLTPNVPFDVSLSGVLRNTEPLDYSHQHNFMLEVKAEDCGGRMSNKTIINVIVAPMCKPGWADVSDRIDFVPGSLKQLILPDAHLNLCDASCDPSQIIAKIKLETSNTGKGCDRDPYSIQSQRAFCGASTEAVDLLPIPTLPVDTTEDNDQVFAFDGETNAVEVPITKMEPHLDEHFTISTWMKHEQDPADKSKHGKKEHILCHSDGEDMNRHHYSVFVHNCRLVLLLRKEAAPNMDMNKFQPAEWRWKLPQTCDGQWHHYAISMDMPQARLYVDGHLHVDSKESAEVIDDWPLHAANSVHYTKLVIGACWHGGEGKLGQYFRGHLAGLSMLKGSTERDSVIQCLNHCQEKLDFHAMADMQTGMSVSLNSELTEITITGHNVPEVEKLLRQVGYANSRVFPASGHRAVSLTTDVSCPEDEEVDVPDLSTSVFVREAEQPVITVSGSEGVSLTETGLEHGEAVLSDVVITILSHQKAQEQALATLYASKLFQGSAKDLGLDSLMAQLDSCLLRVDAVLKPDVEHFKYPTNLIAQLGLEVSETEDSILLSGADSAAHYQQVLRQIRYVNVKAEDLNTRTFILSCSAVSGKYLSNEFITKMSVVHTSHDHLVVPQAAGSNRIYAEPMMKSMNDLSAQDTLIKGSTSGSTSIGVVVIIVVCVGFLLFMIVLGVMRIRSSQQRGGGSSQSEVAMEERPEMEWDNSALTITVNPMDQDTAYDEEYEMNGLPGDDSDDDDASSYHDELESSEEETEKVKDRELEWDDSTLTF